MRLRTIILLLALFAFLAALAGGASYYYSFREAAFQKSDSDAQARLTLLRDQLSTYLSEHVKPVRTMAAFGELGEALARRDAAATAAANRVLDTFRENLEADVAYLMDRDGVTICTSNRDAPDSFLGQDFSFRPYFQRAIAGEPRTYLALGATSKKRGVYASHPVRDPAGGEILGVAVIKSSVEYVEHELFPAGDTALLLADPHGLVFITNRDELRFRLLWELDEGEIARLRATKQFGAGPWDWAGFARRENGDVTDAAGARRLFNGLAVTNHPGWQLVSLRDYRALDRRLSEPFFQAAGPAVVAVLVVAGVLALVLYRMAVGEVAKRKSAEKELRRSEERFRNIYHKTPVMLHSIDVQGHITRVSDHWVEVMGYDRDEVIGTHLTDYFTAESREYALREVFPRFFRTGSCKDVAYTCVKKSGETMDILLSCFGERDEDGNVVRSLAVSVDVTDKNRTQRDLQRAKEQLSEYSRDLEQRVRRRTEQLQKAQDNLQLLSKNIIASQEREKAQVARELHDHLGQVLTALRIDAKWAEKHFAAADGDAGQRFGRMCGLIDDTIDDVRELAYRLRPRVLDDLGLADALDSLVAEVEERSNVSCVFGSGPVPEIDDTLATAMYRIGQEAITNALKHSGATTITVGLGPHGDGIELTITDDGRGFDEDLAREAGGFGLAGMRERASLVGGTIEIVTGPAAGTTVRCRAKV